MALQINLSGTQSQKKRQKNGRCLRAFKRCLPVLGGAYNFPGFYVI